MLKLITASKWGPGISLLWRGNDSREYQKNLIKSFKDNLENNLNKKNNLFLFESARVGLFHLIKFLGINKNDNVQVIGFTCDAVTDSIKALGCDITLYDCNEKLESVKLNIKKNTKLIICQVTFGVPSISDNEINELEKKGITIIYDKALSYGQNDFKKINMKDKNEKLEIISFESSKSFTIGWGGAILIDSNMHDDFLIYYNSLKRTSKINDFFRCILTLINLYKCANGGYFSPIMWYLLRFIGLIRQSKSSSKPSARKNPRLGIFSEKIFNYYFDTLPFKLSKSNKIHNLIKKNLEIHGYKVISRVSEQYSSPRVAFLAEKHDHQNIKNVFTKNNIELGDWFNELPIKSYNTSLPATKKLMEKIINIPCHWTLKEEEVARILNCINVLK